MIESRMIRIRMESSVMADLQEEAKEHGMPLSAYLGYVLTAAHIGAINSGEVPSSVYESVDWGRLKDHFGVPLSEPLNTLG